MTNVIKALEHCKDNQHVNDCYKCDYGGKTGMFCIRMIDDAIALLKEREAVEPIYIENPYTRLPVSYCSKCREPINKYITGNPCRKTEYCHYCGQAVKWE